MCKTDKNYGPVFDVGIENFKTLIESGYRYIDKTAYIKQLIGSNSSYGQRKNVATVSLFLRPRRFGKTLTSQCLSTF